MSEVHSSHKDTNSNRLFGFCIIIILTPRLQAVQTMFYINKEGEKADCLNQVWPTAQENGVISAMILKNSEDMGEFYVQVGGKQVKHQFKLNSQFLSYMDMNKLKYFPMVISSVEDHYYWKKGEKIYILKLFNSKHKLQTSLYSHSQEDHIRLFIALSDRCVLRNFNENYKLTAKIATSLFGEVCNGVHLGSGTEVVAKLYSKKKLAEGRAESLLHQEIKILHLLKKTSISPLIEVYENFEYVILVMHKANGGTLIQFLSNNEKYLNIGSLKQILLKILSSLCILHEVDIIHRDLKPSNIMFSSNSDDCKLFLNDFGISITKEAFEDEEFAHFNCGTQGFIAPEVLQYRRSLGLEPYSEKSDMFSFGCIIYFLFKGKVLFENLTGCQSDEQLEQSIKQKVQKLHLQNSGKDILIKLLHPVPEERLSAKEAKNHVFFKGTQELSQFTFCNKIYGSKKERLIQKIFKQQSKCSK